MPADQFDSMLAHGGLLRAQLSERGLLESGLQLGDWPDPTARRPVKASLSTLGEGKEAFTDWCVRVLVGL